jgi:hypothetical protein
VDCSPAAFTLAAELRSVPFSCLSETVTSALFALLSLSLLPLHAVSETTKTAAKKSAKMLRFIFLFPFQKGTPPIRNGQSLFKFMLRLIRKYGQHGFKVCSAIFRFARDGFYIFTISPNPLFFNLVSEKSFVAREATADSAKRRHRLRLHRREQIFMLLFQKDTTALRAVRA